MNSPKKSTNDPKTSIYTSPSRPSSFIRRKSTSTQSGNVDLQRHVQELQEQLQAKTLEAHNTSMRAEQAEDETRRLKEMASRFWKDEWSGMKDYMMAFSGEEDVREIEERILKEYRGLFGDGQLKGS